MKSTGIARPGTALALNIVFLLYALNYLFPFPKPFLSMVVNLMIFLVPGIGWIPVFGKKVRDAVLCSFLVVCISFAATLSGILLFRLAGIETSSLNMLAYLVVFTNCGLSLSDEEFRFPGFGLEKIRLAELFLLSVILYAVLYIGAARIVPPMEDQDMEPQGTAYGIMHEMTPSMVTIVGRMHYFAHPPLLHLYVGNTFLLMEELDAVSYYHQSALEANGIPRGPDRRQRLREIWERDFRRFLAEPHLIPTRAANLFFAVLTFCLLFFLLFSSTGSFTAALAGPMLYFTFPEVFVRSSYGGYNSITNFCLLSAAYMYFSGDRLDAEEKAKNALFFAAGMFCALADQKTVIIILAMGVLDFARRGGNILNRAGACLQNRITRGFAAGMVLFCVYGMLVDPANFVDYFLMEHVLHRFHFLEAHYEYTGNVTFLSIPALWTEFGRHLGFPFLLVSLPFAVRALLRLDSRESIFGLWFAIGAVLFSLTDWRMTKNLALVILPLLVATILCVSRARTWIKIAFLAAAVCLAAGNAAVIFRLSTDFSTISPHPIW